MALRVQFSHPLRSFEASADLTVEPGETLALVGPSGAGKTTVLRVVAGLLRPRRGLVTLDGTALLDTERGVDVAPERRRVGYLFQEYALFPHLDVLGNVRFGARDGEAARALLERFRIQGLARARVSELSGGERQRVALARALAREPAVLLLDEPLAALDADTRALVRGELAGLLRELALPTLVVTHDFADAAVLAERIAVLVDGEIVQAGSAEELTAAPTTGFVASFTGANVLRGRARPGPAGLTEVVLADGTRLLSASVGGGTVALVVHPWDVSVALEAPDDSMQNHVTGAVASVAPVGNRARVTIGPLTAEVTAASVERLGLRPGTRAVASFKAVATRLVPLDR
jgi:molybdate transport system ATP-binding protein